MYYNSDNSSDPMLGIATNTENQSSTTPTWADFTSGGEQNSSSSSSSFSGLPSWFSDPNNIRNIQTMWNKLTGSLSDYGKYFTYGRDITPAMRAQIESQRQLMPEQYAQQMALSNARQVQQPLNTMSSRGVLNSSVAGDALSKVLREQSARQADQYTQANTWAGNKLIEEMGNRSKSDQTAWQAILNFLPQYLASLRESTSNSQSTGSSSTWGAPGWPGSNE
jgi:hypothetical protein